MKSKLKVLLLNLQVQEVSTATRQISLGTTNVAQTIEEIAKVAKDSASGTQNVAAAAEEQLASMEEISSSTSALTDLAEGLQTVVDKFKINARVKGRIFCPSSSNRT